MQGVHLLGVVGRGLAGVPVAAGLVSELLELHGQRPALFLSIGAADPKVLAAGTDALQRLHDYFTDHVKHVRRRRAARRGDTLLDALLGGSPRSSPVASRGSPSPWSDDVELADLT